MNVIGHDKEKALRVARRMRTLLWFWLCGPLLTVIELCCAQAQALPMSRLVVLLVPGLRADDLTRPELPTLRQRISDGASGWMLCRAARTTDPSLLRFDGRDTTASLLLTLGSGTRALAGQEAFALPTAPNPLEQQRALDALQERNSRLEYPVPLGALGDLLHHAHLKTALLGDFDAETPDRAALLLAMDTAGGVDIQIHVGYHADDAAAPYGFRADTDRILRDFEAATKDTSLIVLAFGDLERADRYAPLCLPSIAAIHRSRALAALESLLQALSRQLRSEPHSSLILLAPAPAESTPERLDRIAPILLWGPDIRPGTLTSASTRRTGLVLNTDFLPTVAQLFHLPAPPNLTGRPMTSIVLSSQSGGNLGTFPPTPESLRAAHDAFVQTAVLQNALGGLPTVQMLLVLAGCTTWFLQRRWPATPLGEGRSPIHEGRSEQRPYTEPTARKGVSEGRKAEARIVKGRPLQYTAEGSTAKGFNPSLSIPLHRLERLAARLLPVTAIAIVALPLGMLILPPVAPGNVWGAGALLAAFTLLLAGLALQHGVALPLLYVLSGALLGVTVVDLLTGSHLLRQAWMSYSVMEGARFYGLGNEYMGAVIGAGCILIRMKDEGGRMKKRLVRFILHPSSFILLLVVLGWSRFGAKVGAIPSAGAAFGVAWLVQWRGRLRARDGVMLLVAAILLLITLAWFDLRHAAGEQSHLARAISGAGGGSLFEIARRKLLLEGYLLLHSPWSATLAVSAFGMFWLKRSCAEAFASNDAKAVFAGLMAGALASLLCNDAGLLAAALILLYGWAWAAICVSAGNISDEVTSNLSG